MEQLVIELTKEELILKLEKQKRELKLQVKAQQKIIHQQTKQINQLLEQLKLYARRQFGDKSEKATNFDEPGEITTTEEQQAEKADKESTVAAHKRTFIKKIPGGR